MPRPQPGWYRDPHRVESLRWWDGQRWSEHVVVPDGPAPWSSRTLRGPGETIGAAFRAVGMGWQPVGIAAAVHATVLAISLGPMTVGLRDVYFDGSVWRGFDTSEAGVLGAIGIVLVVVGGVVSAVLKYHFVAVERRAVRPWRDSLARCLRRTPRVFGWLIALLIVAIAVVALPFGGFALHPLLGVLALVVAVFALAVLWPASQLLLIGVMVLPGSRNPLAATVALMRRRVVAIVARFVLIGGLASFGAFSVGATLGQLTAVLVVAGESNDVYDTQTVFRNGVSSTEVVFFDPSQISIAFGARVAFAAFVVAAGALIVRSMAIAGYATVYSDAARANNIDLDL